VIPETSRWRTVIARPSLVGQLTLTARVWPPTRCRGVDGLGWRVTLD
jgi:hypothetical protein